MKTTNYWRDIYEPMTREHYKRGGYYREVTYERDVSGHDVSAVVGRVLTVDEAMARRRGAIEIVYAQIEALT